MPQLSIREPRKITITQSMYYPASSLHPDRILPEHDLIFLEEGEWEIWEEDVSYRLQPGDVLLLFAGRHHFGRQGCAPGTRTMFLHVTGCPGDVFAAEPQVEAQGGIYLPSFIHCRKVPAVQGYFRQLIQVYWSEDANRDLRLAALFQLLLCELSSALQQTDNPRRQLALAVQNLLQVDSQGTLDIHALARRFQVTPRSLRYAFTQEIGMPIHRYHLNLRLDMAMNMLRTDGHFSLRELAEAFGFYDEFHFSRAFKQRFGVAPRNIE